jgi:hypothetical protein
MLEKNPKPQAQQAEEFKQTIAGQKEDESETRVAGGSDDEDEELVRIKGGSKSKKEAIQKVSGSGEKTKGRFKSLFKNLIGKKGDDSDGEEETIVVKGSEKAEEPSSEKISGDVFDSLFKAEEVPTPPKREIPESPYQLIKDEKFDEPEAPVVAVEGAEPSKVSEMLQQLENLTSETSEEKIEEMTSEIRKELKSETAQRLFDQTVTAMIAERSKIKDTTRRMNAAMRQKEIEVQAKENSFKEGLREKEEQIRQKTMLLEKAREQIQNAAAEIERLKESTMRRTDANPMLKQKLAQMQNELNSNQEINTKLMANVDELKKRLAQEKNARMAAIKTTGPSQQEMLALQQRAERATKQAEEYRKNNARLLERLEQASKRQSGSSVDSEESKRKLATATKMLAASKKDSENLNGIIHRMKVDELKLKGELNRVTQEVNKLKSQAAQQGQTGAQPAAAPDKDKKDPKAA